MSVSNIIILLLLGFAAGMLSSLAGIGGGIVIVPVLIVFLGFDQIKAQGTSLAMLLLPIGIFGVMEYYKKGQVDLKVAAVLCVAFIAGSFLGAKLVMTLDKIMVKRFFAIFLIIVAIKFLFIDKPAKKTELPKTSSSPSDLK